MCPRYWPKTLVTLCLSAFCISFGASAQTDTSEQALNTLNSYRRSMGLGTLVWQPQLSKTAKAHSRYLAAVPDRKILSQLASDGTPEMHRERVGYANFTGVTLGDRVQRQGYRFIASEQVVLNEQHNHGDDVVDQLMTTVYHRSGLLNPAWSELGVAVDKPNAVLIMGEGVTKTRMPSDWIAHFPADNATVRQIAFQNEIPDPAPERHDQWLGLPISIHSVAGRQIQIQRFELREVSAPKHLVEGKILTSNNDRLIAKHEAFFLPTYPLNYAKQYEVEVNFLLDQKPQAMHWMFQTPPDPFKIFPNSAVTEVTPGIVERLELQGIQGNWTWNITTTSPSKTHITTHNLGKGKMDITFPNSCNETCRVKVEINHQGPHPSTATREFVVSKAWLASRPTPIAVMPQELLAAAAALRRQPSPRSLAYGHQGERWFWSTAAGAPDQTSADQTALDGCNQQAQKMNLGKVCRLHGGNPPHS